MLGTLRVPILFILISTFPTVQPRGDWKKKIPKGLIIYDIWELFKNLE